ncbi:dihydrolipoamide acetyltransferase component of pyruvate dehydrogenase complex [Klebsiella pneumoniae subsp. rhinoscleromatis]|nr:dihydrolipoamide acetyltransferase component of pyruvate dehydrogenase complex [Klebsiella pneumoniae subsp. rhinoscleromatis]
MAIEIKVPDIGADEVEITEILVKVGDKVEAEQSADHRRRRQSLYGSPVSAGWRRERD